jgi:hypothetical protein
VIFIMATKKGRTTNVSPLLFCCCFWIRDPGSGIRDGYKSGSGTNIPDTQHCITLFWNIYFGKCPTRTFLHMRGEEKLFPDVPCRPAHWSTRPIGVPVRRLSHRLDMDKAFRLRIFNFFFLKKCHDS